jgi:hypothetical protein
MLSSEESNELTMSDFEDDLYIRFSERAPTIAIAVNYLSSFGIQTSRRNLQRKMKEWSIQKNKPRTQVVADEAKASLVEKLSYMYHHFRYLNDA